MVMMMMVYEREGFAADDEKDDELHLLAFLLTRVKRDIQYRRLEEKEHLLVNLVDSTDPFANLVGALVFDFAVHQSYRIVQCTGYTGTLVSATTRPC